METTDEVPSDVRHELESTIGAAEQTYANPELDAIVAQAVALVVKEKDPLEVEVQIEEKKPSREWILLQGYKGYKALAALYRNIGELGLEQSNLAQALIRAKAIKGGRDLTATTLPLPSLSVELHDAIQNLAFFQDNMLKRSLIPPESSTNPK